MKRKLLILADLLRADLLEFAALIERDDIEGAVRRLRQIAKRIRAHAKEMAK